MTGGQHGHPERKATARRSCKRVSTMLEPRQVKTLADAKAIVEQRKLAHVKVGVFDIDGIMRGKYMSRAKFLSALESGFGFCDVVLGWDCQDQLYDNVQYTGWHTGYPDAPVRILPETCRPLPFEDDDLFFLGEFAPPAEQVCPRGIAAATCSNARAAWASSLCRLRVRSVLLQRDAASRCARRTIAICKPMAPGWFGYSVIRNSVGSRVLSPAARRRARRWTSASRACTRKPVPGVIEAAIGFDEALASADKAALFKTFAKVLAQTQRHDGDVHGEVVARLARPERPHPSVAARSSDGKPVFHDAGTAALDERDHAPFRRRPAEADAGTARDGLADDQFVHAADSRVLGADGLDVSASRTARARCASFRAARNRSASSIASPRPMRIPTSSLPPRSARDCGASSNSIEPEPLVEGNAYDRKFPDAAGVAAHALGCRAAPERVARWRASGSATPSSSTSPRRASGKSANSASTSRIGSWRAISRSFEDVGLKPDRQPDLHRSGLSPTSRRMLQTISPIDDSVYVERPARESGAKSTARSIVRAERSAAWRNVAVAERARILTRFCDAFESKRDAIAHELTWQMGRPIRYAPERSARHARTRAPHDRDRSGVRSPTSTQDPRRTSLASFGASRSASC